MASAFERTQKKNDGLDFPAKAKTKCHYLKTIMDSGYRLQVPACGLLGRAKCGRHGQVAAGNFRRGSRSPEATLFLFIYPNFSWSNSPVDRLPLLLKLLANETMNFTVLAHSYFVGQCPAVRVEYWRRHRYMVLDAQCPASHSMKYLGSPESTPTRS